MNMISRTDENDVSTAAELAALLFSENADELEDELRSVICGENGVIFLALDDDTAIGFAQCQLRHDYVEGTHGSPVGYLEGIYISEEYRRCGYALELLRACEQWAMEHGCTEFASDCELKNQTSYDFHMSVGFEEANRIICFTKKL